MNKYSPILYQILLKNSIIDYLSKKGFEPARIMGDGKHFYYCPMPDHDDSKSPSFVVYTNAEFENFYCFGCGAKYHFIDLYSKMESVPKKEAIKKFGEGIGIDITDEISYEIENIEKQVLESQNPIKEISKVMMEISTTCKSFLISVNNNIKEKEIIDNFYKMIDTQIMNKKYNEIIVANENLMEFLRFRLEKFNDIKEDDEIDVCEGL